MYISSPPVSGSFLSFLHFKIVFVKPATISHCGPLKLPRNWLHNLVFWSVRGFDSPDFVKVLKSLSSYSFFFESDKYTVIVRAILIQRRFFFSFHYSRLKKKVVWFTEDCLPAIGANVSPSLFSKVHLYSSPYSLDKRSQWVATRSSIGSRCVVFYIIWRTQKQARKAVANSKKLKKMQVCNQNISIKWSLIQLKTVKYQKIK